MSQELIQLIEQIRHQENVLRQGGGPKAIARQHQKGRLTARERIAGLIDDGTSFFELGLWAAWNMYADWGGAPSAGVITGVGTVSGRRVMAEAVFAPGVPFGARKTLPATIRDLARLMPASAGLRRWGSAALDLAYVAAGRFDGYWEREINAWDMAAGLVIVREAGGFAEAVREGRGIFDSGSVIAANADLFAPFAAVLRAPE